MSPWKLQVSAIFCCFLSVHVLSDGTTPEPANFESFPPDLSVEQQLEKFQQAVLKTIVALNAKLDERVGDLDAKMRVLQGTLSELDRKIEDTIREKLQLVGSISHPKESIRNYTGESVERSPAIVVENMAVDSDSLVGNLSCDCEVDETLIKDPEEMFTTSATPLVEDGMSALDDEDGNARRDEIIGSILNRTSGMLFSGVDFTGQVFNYDLKTSESSDGCLKLPGSAQSVRSVNPQNSCIRLFPSTGCIGLSLAFYPGSENSHLLLSYTFKTSQSLGPCLANEFEFATTTNNSSSSGTISLRKDKLKDISDIALISTYNIFSSDSKTKALSSSTNPVKNYLMDSSYRIKYFRAVIYDRHLIQTPQVSQMRDSSAVWRAFEKRDGDDLGFIIPLSMGGPGNESYNVFPQSPSNELDWAGVLERVTSFIWESGRNYVELHLNFVYPNEVTNRPRGFYYWLNMVDRRGFEKIRYGFIRN